MKLSNILTQPLLALGGATLLIGLIKGNRIYYKPARAALHGSCTPAAIADYYSAYAYQIGNPALAIKYFYSAKEQVAREKKRSFQEMSKCELLDSRLNELAIELFRIQTSQ